MARDFGSFGLVLSIGQIDSQNFLAWKMGRTDYESK